MFASTEQTRPSFAKPGSLLSGFYSVSEAAAISNCSEESLRRAIRERRIPAFGTRGRIRVRLNDVLPCYVSMRKQQQA